MMVRKEGTACANVKIIVKDLEDELKYKSKSREAYKGKFLDWKKKYESLVQKHEELIRKMEQRTKIGEETKETGVQVLDQMKIENVEAESGSKKLEKRIEEVLQRVKRLEEGRDMTRGTDVDNQGETLPWSRILGRRMKKKMNRDPSLTNTGKRTVQNKIVENRRKKEGEETEVKKKRKAMPLQMLKKRLPRGAGVLLELQGGAPEDYEEVIKRCQKEISLEAIGIPPLE